MFKDNFCYFCSTTIKMLTEDKQTKENLISSYWIVEKQRLKSLGSLCLAQIGARENANVSLSLKLCLEIVLTTLQLLDVFGWLLLQIYTTSTSITLKKGEEQQRPSISLLMRFTRYLWAFKDNQELSTSCSTKFPQGNDYISHSGLTRPDWPHLEACLVYQSCCLCP